MRFLLMLAVTCIVLSADSQARKAAVSAGCANLQEQVTLSVNYNISGDSFAQVKAKYDEKMKTVQESAAKQGVKQFDMQSTNYNINPKDYNNAESGVQLNGSSSFRMDNADAAFKLAEFLNTQKFNASISVNAYQNGNCNNVMVE